MSNYPLEWGNDQPSTSGASDTSDPPPATKSRYPLEWGWDTPSEPDAPQIKPVTPTLLGGADPDSLGTDASRPPVQLAQAADPEPDNELRVRTWSKERGQWGELDQPREVHGEPWTSQFLLTKPTPTGGHVVQKITHTYPDIPSETSWEAWKIEPGRRQTEQATRLPLSDDDKFIVDNPSAPPGRYGIEAEARFYPGPLPETFKPGVFERAPEQLGTHTKPDFWTDSAKGAKFRSWTYDVGKPGAK